MFTEHQLPYPGKKLNAFFLSSCSLAAISLLTLMFKSVSESAWNGTYGSTTLALHGAENTDERYVNLQLFSNISTASNALAWASISISLAIALLSVYIDRRAQTKGPLACTWAQRACFYSVYHAGLVLFLTTFSYLTYLHSQSDHFSPASSFPEIIGGKTCLGLCAGTYSGFQLDREMWACDVNATPEVEDPDHVSRALCVGETATRGLLLVLGLGTAMLAALLELDRRRERRLMISWKARARSECEFEL